MQHGAYGAERRGNCGSSVRHLQLLELVPFELERVLVDGNDRIELLAVCARARDELALLSALDHARRVEPAFVGTRVDLPGRVRRRWASGSSEGWCCKYGAGWVASERRGRGRTVFRMGLPVAL